jgi:hypothetical protein
MAQSLTNGAAPFRVTLDADDRDGQTLLVQYPAVKIEAIAKAVAHKLSQPLSQNMHRISM